MTLPSGERDEEIALRLQSAHLADGVCVTQGDFPSKRQPKKVSNLVPSVMEELAAPLEALAAESL